MRSSSSQGQRPPAPNALPLSSLDPKSTPTRCACVQCPGLWNFMCLERISRLSPSNPPPRANSILVKGTTLPSFEGSLSPNPRSLWRPSTLDLFIGLQFSSNNHINHIFLPLWEKGDTDELRIVRKLLHGDMKQTWNACWKSPSRLVPAYCGLCHKEQGVTCPWNQTQVKEQHFQWPSSLAIISAPRKASTEVFPQGLDLLVVGLGCPG